MPVTGLVLRQNLPNFEVVSTYYGQAPHEPTRRGLLPVDRVDVFGNTFLGLVQAIFNSKRSHVVVVAHGSTQSGLMMPITVNSSLPAGEAIKTLLPVVDSLDTTQGKSASASSLSVAAKDWSVSQADVLKVAKACWSVRWAENTAFAVHIRGCNIGADTKHLERLRALFRSQVVSAPDAPMFFVKVRPYYPKPDVAAWAKANPTLGRRFTYTKQAGGSAGPMVLDCEYIHGGGSRSQAAVKELADIKRWAAWVYQNPNTTATSSFVAAGFYPDGDNDYYLAAEPGYIDHIAAVTA